MIGLLAAFVIGVQTPAPTAAGLIGRMFKHYADAKTIYGTIRLVQSSMQHSMEVDTTLAVERPDLIYLRQEQPHSDKTPVELVSDGVQFAYTAIPSPLSPPKLIESEHPTDAPAQHVGDMYFCLLPTLLDRSLPLDVAISRTDHLKLVTVELASFSIKGQASVRNIPTYEIDGQWKDALANQIAGTFELYVTPAGDLVRLTRHQFFAVSPKWLIDHHLPADSFSQGIEVVNTWDADLTVDQPVNRSLFNLHR
jgi:hypothetical protein